jgi:acetyltransferase-like isoleucine patch superfamily enzyme
VKRLLQKLVYRFVAFGNAYQPPNPFLKSKILTVGEYTYGIPQVVKYSGDTNKVIIGKFCSIAGEVNIFVGGNHRIDWVSTFPFRIRFDLPGKYQDGHPASRGDVIIGSDVWIGYGATILSGVTVGHGAVIAARSVVTHDVAPYSIIGGNPAKLIKSRFNKEQIASLLKIAWWDWSIEQILKFVPSINNSNIDDFIEQTHLLKQQSQ